MKPTYRFNLPAGKIKDRRRNRSKGASKGAIGIWGVMKVRRAAKGRREGAGAWPASPAHLGDARPVDHDGHFCSGDSGLSGQHPLCREWRFRLWEGRANRLDGQARLRIGGGDLVVSSAFVPQIRLSEVTLMSARGQRFVQIADLRTSLDTAALWKGGLCLRSCAPPAPVSRCAGKRTEA